MNGHVREPGRNAVFYRMLILLFLLCIPFVQQLHAQTAARLEALLNEKAVTWEQASAFVLEAADAGAYTNPQDAFNVSYGYNWLPKDIQSGDTARLDGVALLLMRSFELKGGMFYSMTKSPHHAYRELVFKKVIRGTSDPRMNVSGQDLLLMIGRMLAMRENAGKEAP